jgi:hypothetical protein
MNDTYKNKYRILDLIFTFFNSLCMVLAAIFMLKNLIVSLTFVVTVVLIALVFLFFWISRNPFTIYLVRGFAYNNLFFTFFALMYFYSVIFPVSTSQLAYILLLLPAIFYLTFSFKFSSISYRHDKRTGATLAYWGRTKAAEKYLFKDKLEDKKNREERIAELKKVYPYKILIFLVVVLTLSSFYALTLGFY